MKQSNAPTPWYWFVISGIFLIISIVFASWSTNREWDLSHDCQCGTPFGTSQGDYATSHILLQVIPSLLIVAGLLIHPVAGMIVSGAMVVVNVIRLGRLISDPEPGVLSGVVLGHAIFLLLLGFAGVVISITKLIISQSRSNRSTSKL